MDMVDYLILGAGISGLSASYHLKQKGYESIIIEKESQIGGLCRSFKINGFTFDHFIHLSFTQNDYVKSIFNSMIFSIYSPVICCICRQSGNLCICVICNAF